MVPAEGSYVFSTYVQHVYVNCFYISYSSRCKAFGVWEKIKTRIAQSQNSPGRKLFILIWLTWDIGSNQVELFQWTKISSLEITVFDLKMMVKSGLEFFYFEIHQAPSEIPANLPGSFFYTGKQQLLKGSVNFKMKILGRFSP